MCLATSGQGVEILTHVRTRSHSQMTHSERLAAVQAKCALTEEQVNVSDTSFIRVHPLGFVDHKVTSPCVNSYYNDHTSPHTHACRSARAINDACLKMQKQCIGLHAYVLMRAHVCAPRTVCCDCTHRL